MYRVIYSTESEDYWRFETMDTVYCTTQKEAERLVKMLEASSQVIKDSVTWCFPETKR